MAVTSKYGSTYNAVINTRILDRSMELETQLNTFFHPMTREFQKGDRAPGSVVLKKTDFIEQGRDSMIYTLSELLTGEGTMGDMQLLGHEAEQSHRYYEANVHRKRHGVKSNGRMSRQRSKQLDFFLDAKSQLVDWWALERDYSKFKALAEGRSPHVLAALAAGGYAWNSGTAIPHPNLFVAGESDGTYATDGLVTWSDTASTYVTNVAKALYNQLLAGAAAKNKFSFKLLDRMIPWLEYLKIKPIKADGKQFYVVVLHTNQIQQSIEAGGDYRNILTTVGTRGEKNPIWTGALGMYMGKFLIHVSPIVLGAYSSAGTSTVYGTTTPHTALDTYDQKLALVMGQSAVCEAVAQGEDLQFDTEMTDYNNFQGIAASRMWGDARPDLSSDANPAPTGRLKKNISSAIIATYSARGAVTSEVDTE